MHAPTKYRLGVGIVLVNRQGLIFAGQRRDGRLPPWQMPQGGLQPGETPAEAAGRELEEELGTSHAEVIEVFPEWLRYDYPEGFKARRAQCFRGQQHLWFLMRFTGRDCDIGVAGSHAEFEAWQWMRPPEVVDAVVAFKRKVYREVIAYFAPSVVAVAAGTGQNGGAMRRLAGRAGRSGAVSLDPRGKQPNP